MKEIRLDYLQNPPLNLELSNLFLPNYHFDSIADKNNASFMDMKRDSIKAFFKKDFALPFSFTAGGFAEVFLQFKKIYFLPTLHYEIRRALQVVSPFVEVIKLDSTQAFLECDNTLDSAKKDEILMILPLVNEDIFNLNAITKIRNATTCLDISYALALGLEIVQEADIFVINAMSLGLPRDFGLIISHKSYTSNIYKKGVSEAIFMAITERKNAFKNANKDENLHFFEALKSHFGKDISLFCDDFMPHTLPLRLRYINTRYLIEHLYLDNIFIHASQDCSLGFIKPSHTLLSMGFSPLVARELCAVSFYKIYDINLVAEKIFESYKMIRLMEF